jgi:hypothetical protein
MSIVRINRQYAVKLPVWGSVGAINLLSAWEEEDPSHIEWLRATAAECEAPAHLRADVTTTGTTSGVNSSANLDYEMQYREAVLKELGAWVLETFRISVNELVTYVYEDVTVEFDEREDLTK